MEVIKVLTCLCFLSCITLTSAAKSAKSPVEILKSGLKALQERPDIVEGVLSRLPEGQQYDGLRMAFQRLNHYPAAAFQSQDNPEDCDLCEAGIGIIRFVLELGVDRDDIIEILRLLCVQLLRDELRRADYFCPGLIRIQGNAVLDALEDLPENFNNTRVCQLLNTCIFKDPSINPKLKNGNRKTPQALKMIKELSMQYKQKVMLAMRPDLRYMGIGGIPEAGGDVFAADESTPNAMQTTVSQAPTTTMSYTTEQSSSSASATETTLSTEESSTKAPAMTTYSTESSTSPTTVMAPSTEQSSSQAPAPEMTHPTEISSSKAPETEVTYSTVGSSSKASTATAKYSTELGSSTEPAMSTLSTGSRSATTESRSATTESSRDTFTVVQLTDIHINPEYTEHSATDCGMYVCCYPYYEGEGSAGRYGDYQCNIPERTIELFLGKVKELQPQPEFVLYSGDTPPHQMHNETYQFQLDCSENLMSLLQRNMLGWTIYPAIGNHEMYPTNIYSTRLDNTKTMTEKFGEWWAPFAKFGSEQLETWNKAGYYTVLTNRTGLRIVGFNTNYGYTMNFYNVLNIDSDDYKEQFTFLRNILQNATDHGEKVIMIGHHPPGRDDTHYLWGREYTDLIRRFHTTVVLQVFGHTHSDHFQMFTDASGATPVNVAFISPSISSSIGKNPSLRLFTFEADTYRLVDFEQHYLHLENANKGNPEIVKSYGAKEAYGMTDMSPASWSNLANRLETDDVLFQKYLQNHFTRVNQSRPCDHNCRVGHVCSAKFSSYDRYLACYNEKKIDITTTPSLVTMETRQPTKETDAPVTRTSTASLVTEPQTCPPCPPVVGLAPIIAPTFVSYLITMATTNIVLNY